MIPLYSGSSRKNILKSVLPAPQRSFFNKLSQDNSNHKLQIPINQEKQLVNLSSGKIKNSFLKSTMSEQQQTPSYVIEIEKRFQRSTTKSYVFPRSQFREDKVDDLRELQTINLYNLHDQNKTFLKRDSLKSFALKTEGDELDTLHQQKYYSIFQLGNNPYNKLTKKKTLQSSYASNNHQTQNYSLDIKKQIESIRMKTVQDDQFEKKQYRKSHLKNEPEVKRLNLTLNFQFMKNGQIKSYSPIKK